MTSSAIALQASDYLGELRLLLVLLVVGVALKVWPLQAHSCTRAGAGCTAGCRS